MLIKRLVLLVNIIIILSFLWMGQKQLAYEGGDSPVLPLEGYLAPSFTLESFQGDEINFEEDLLGKTVLINFWASWCPPCKAEMPDLVEVAEMYQEEVVFVGINVSTQDTLKKATEFIDYYGVNYLNLQDKDGHVSKLYQVPPIPTTVVVNKDGTIIFRKMGGMTKAEIISAIKEGL